MERGSAARQQKRPRSRRNSAEIATRDQGKRIDVREGRIRAVTATARPGHLEAYHGQALGEGVKVPLNDFYVITYERVLIFFRSRPTAASKRADRYPSRSQIPPKPSARPRSSRSAVSVVQRTIS